MVLLTPGACLAGMATVLLYRVGTMVFMAPEMLTNLLQDSAAEGSLYDPFALDMWAVGCCIFLIALGACPFITDAETVETEDVAIASLIQVHQVAWVSNKPF